MHLPFPSIGIINSLKLFQKDKFNRKPLFCVFRSQSCLMFSKPELDIVGASCIERTVRTFKNIQVASHNISSYYTGVTGLMVRFFGFRVYLLSRSLSALILPVPEPVEGPEDVLVPPALRQALRRPFDKLRDHPSTSSGTALRQALRRSSTGPSTGSGTAQGPPFDRPFDKLRDRSGTGGLITAFRPGARARQGGEADGVCRPEESRG